MDEFHSPYMYVGNNPILYIDFFGMSSDENIPYWGYTETINVYGDRVNPSWYNPGGWFSWMIFGNQNYWEVLYNRDMAMKHIANMMSGLIAATASAGMIGRSEKAAEIAELSKNGSREI